MLPIRLEAKVVLGLVLVIGMIGSASAWSNYTSPGEYSYSVPSNAQEIKIIMAGGRGGCDNSGCDRRGGYGAVVESTLDVSGGETLKVMVGEKGNHPPGGNGGGSGGGGSFVWRDSDNTPIAIAGAGGGALYNPSYVGGDASVNNIYTLGGSAGASPEGGGGAGWSSSASGSIGGTRPLDGGQGGSGVGSYGADGGFGGGGGSTDSDYSPGGGAGASGGDGGSTDKSQGGTSYLNSNFNPSGVSTSVDNYGDGYVKILVLNTPPSFDSSSITPDPPLVGENVSYSANTSDADGSVDYVNLTLNYGGSTVVQDNKKSGANVSWPDVYKPSSGNKWLNATLEAVDNDGDVTTKEVNRYLSNDAPTVSLNSPDNKTYYGYNRSLEFSVSDSDSLPGEDHQCDISQDGSLKETVNVSEGSSYSSDYLVDVGSHNFSVECSDPAGNTNQSSQYFSVDLFEISSVSGSSQIYETQDGSYHVDLTAGSMVEEFNASLFWNGEKRSSRNFSNSAVNSYSEDLFFRPPLQQNNASEYNWSIQVEAVYQDFNASTTSVEKRNSSTKNQSVWQAYHSPEISVPADKVIEKEDFQADLSFTNELALEVADINAYQTFNGSTDQARSTTFDYPLVGQGNKSTKTVSGRIDISFRDKSLSRDTVSNDSLTGYKKIVTDCSQGSASQTVFHEYVVYNEENRTEKLDSDIDYNYDVTHHGEHSRNYAFGRSGKSVDTCIYPSWAEYRVTGPLQYNSQDFTARAYRFYNATINNQTERINLYLLPEADSTAVYYRVEEADGSGIEGATVKTMRYFVDQNSYLTVSKVETDSNGEAQTYQKINDIYYKYVITKNGEVLKETENQILTCRSTPCTKVFTVDPNTVSEYFSQKKAFSYSCRVNEGDPSLQCTVNHDSGSMERATLKVEEHQRIGDETLCDIETVQTGSSMVCELNNLSKYSYSYELKGYKDGDQYILTYGSVDRTDGIMGNDSNSLFFAMFLVLVAAGLGNYSPGAAIMWTSVGLSAVYLTGILTIPLTALTGIIAVGIIGLLEVRS